MSDSKIMVMDLGTKLTKVSVFNVETDFNGKKENKDLQSFSLLYHKIFDTTSNADIAILELDRVLNLLGRNNIDEYIILAKTDAIVNKVIDTGNKVDYKSIKRICKNRDMEEDKTYKDSLHTYIFEDFSLDKNEVKILHSKINNVDLKFLTTLIKTLKISNVKIYSGTACMKSLVPKNENAILFDLGYSNQSLSLVSEGVLGTTKVHNSRLDKLDEALLKVCIPSELELTKRKHNITEFGSEIEEIFSLLSIELKRFVDECRNVPKLKVYYLGGLSAKDFGNYMPEYAVGLPTLDERFKNKGLIPNTLLKYLYPSIASIYATYDYEETVDFLRTPSSLQFLSFKLNEKLVTKAQVSFSVIMFGYILASLGVYVGVNDKLVPISDVGAQSVQISKTEYGKQFTGFKSSIESNEKSGLSFKLSETLSTMGNGKPSTVNLKRLQYTEDSTVITLWATNLEDVTYFKNHIQRNLFASVKETSPKVIIPGDAPIYQVNLVGVGYTERE